MDNVLIAKDGMVYTDDSTYGTTIVLGKGDDGSKWYEITAEEAEARQTEDLPTEDAATEADYQAALREMGVKV